MSKPENVKEDAVGGSALSAGLGLIMETIIPPPDKKRDLVNKLVIGTSFAPLAFGHEFCIAHCGFFDGALLHPLFNALVYDGDEITIGGRKIIREKGDEFWIVRFSEERFVFNRLVQSESPNVELRGSAEGGVPLERRVRNDHD
jgi:hypothetical protein